MKIIPYKFLRVLAVACLATAVVLVCGLSESQRSPKAGGLPSDAKSVISDDSAKTITEADSTNAQDSMKVVKEKRRRHFARRPTNYPSGEMDGFLYIDGIMYFETDADTALVSSFGIRVRRCVSRTKIAVGYRAMWPTDLVLDSLPPQVVDVAYPRLSKPQ